MKLSHKVLVHYELLGVPVAHDLEEVLEVDVLLYWKEDPFDIHAITIAVSSSSQHRTISATYLTKFPYD
jgi:hypothetical protein